MMGRQEAGQAPLFYAFKLEDAVPASHMLRSIDQLLDLGELHQHLTRHYSHTGRPPPAAGGLDIMDYLHLTSVLGLTPEAATQLAAAEGGG